MIAFYIFIAGILSAQIPDAAAYQLYDTYDDSSDSSEESDLVPAKLSKGMTQQCYMFNDCIQFIRRVKEGPAVAQNFTNVIKDFGQGVAEIARNALGECLKKGFLDAVTCIHDSMVKMKKVIDSVGNKIQPTIEYTSDVKKEFEKCLVIESHL